MSFLRLSSRTCLTQANYLIVSLSTSRNLHIDYKLIADELSVSGIIPHSDSFRLIRFTIQNTGRVIGVSKPCCPVCMKLLSGKDSFIVRGSHQTLSPCTLPKWAPESLAQDAIKYYSGRLREALEKLMKTSTELRSRARAKSTQSDALSLDTHEDHESLNFFMEDYKDYPGPRGDRVQFSSFVYYDYQQQCQAGPQSFSLNCLNISSFFLSYTQACLF